MDEKWLTFSILCEICKKDLYILKMQAQKTLKIVILHAFLNLKNSKIVILDVKMYLNKQIGLRISKENIFWILTTWQGKKKKSGKCRKGN